MRESLLFVLVVVGSSPPVVGCSGSGGAEDIVDHAQDDAEAIAEGTADADADGSGETGSDGAADVVEADGPDAAVDVEPDGGEDGGDAGGDAEAEADVPPLPVPECASAEGCTLHTDCCHCLALAPGETPPPCDLTECFVTTCTPRGITEADVVCAAGRCAAGYDCDDSHVACLAPPPICPAGEVPSVSGLCWGPCVSAEECAYVTDCARCDPAIQFCVTVVQRSGPVRHCVDRADACAGEVSCACEGPGVCVSPFDVCGDGVDGLSCSCPVCG